MKIAFDILGGEDRKRHAFRSPSRRVVFVGVLFHWSFAFFFLGGSRFWTGSRSNSSAGRTASPWESWSIPSKETVCSARSMRPIWFRWKSHISASFSWERCRSIRNFLICLPNKTNALGTPYRVFRQAAQIYTLIR